MPKKRNVAAERRRKQQDRDRMEVHAQRLAQAHAQAHAQAVEEAMKRHMREIEDATWLVVEGQEEGEPEHKAMGVYRLYGIAGGRGVWQKAKGPCKNWPDCPQCNKPLLSFGAGSLVSNLTDLGSPCRSPIKPFGADHILYSAYFGPGKMGRWIIGLTKSQSHLDFTPAGTRLERDIDDGRAECDLWVDTQATTPDQIADSGVAAALSTFWSGGLSGKWVTWQAEGNEQVNLPKVRVRIFTQADVDKYMKEEEEQLKRIEVAIEKALEQATAARSIVLEGLAEDDPEREKMGIYNLMLTEGEPVKVNGRGVWQQDEGISEGVLFYHGSKWIVSSQKYLSAVFDREAIVEDLFDLGCCGLCVGTSPAELTPDQATQHWKVLRDEGCGSDYNPGFHDVPNVKARAVSAEEHLAEVGLQARRREEQAVAAGAASVLVGLHSLGSREYMGEYCLLEGTAVNGRPVWVLPPAADEVRSFALFYWVGQDDWTPYGSSFSRLIVHFLPEMMSSSPATAKSSAPVADPHGLAVWSTGPEDGAGSPVQSMRDLATDPELRQKFAAIASQILLDTASDGPTKSPLLRALLEANPEVEGLVRDAEWMRNILEPATMQAMMQQWRQSVEKGPELSILWGGGRGWAIAPMPADGSAVSEGLGKLGLKDVCAVEGCMLGTSHFSRRSKTDARAEANRPRAAGPDRVQPGTWQVMEAEGWEVKPALRVTSTAVQTEENKVVEAAKSVAGSIVVKGHLPDEVDKCHLSLMGVYEVMEGRVVNGRAVWQQKHGGYGYMFIGTRTLMIRDTVTVPHARFWWIGSKEQMERGEGGGIMAVRAAHSREPHHQTPVHGQWGEAAWYARNGPDVQSQRSSSASQTDALNNPEMCTVEDYKVLGLLDSSDPRWLSHECDHDIMQQKKSFYKAPKLSISAITEAELQALAVEDERAMMEAEERKCVVVQGLAQGHRHYDKMGQYVLVAGQVVNGRGVWQQQRNSGRRSTALLPGHEFFLYYSSKKWLISDHACTGATFGPETPEKRWLFLTADSAESDPPPLTPDQASGEWQVQDAVSARGWNAAPELKVQAESELQRIAKEHADTEAEERARKAEEEQARVVRVTEQQAKKDRLQKAAEEQASKEAQKKAHEQTQEQTKKKAESEAKKKARERTRRVAEEKAKKMAEDQAMVAKKGEDERARKQAAKAKRAAEKRAKKEAEEMARLEAVELARKEEEEKADREAEERAREVEEQARKEVEEKERVEAELMAKHGAGTIEEAREKEAMQREQKEADERAKREADEQAKREAKEQAKREAAEKARKEAEEQTVMSSVPPHPFVDPAVAAVGRTERLTESFPPLSSAHGAGSTQRARKIVDLPPSIPLPPPKPLKGYLFMSSRDTFPECIRRNLFGSPRSVLREMRDSIAVDGSTVLFLLNFQTAELHGVFTAVGQSQLDIEPDAWKVTGRGRRYPAQVRVHRLDVRPIFAAVSVPNGSKRTGLWRVGTEGDVSVRLDREESRTLKGGPLDEQQTRSMLVKLLGNSALSGVAGKLLRNAMMLGANAKRVGGTGAGGTDASKSVEDQKAKVAKERARREAETKAKKDAETKKAEARARSRKEAEEQAKEGAKEQAKKEAEEQAKKEAEEQAKKEAEGRLRHEAEEQAVKEVEEMTRKEAEERDRQEEEAYARQEADARAMLDGMDDEDEEEQAREVEETKEVTEEEEEEGWVEMNYHGTDVGAEAKEVEAGTKEGVVEKGQGAEEADEEEEKEESGGAGCTLQEKLRRLEEQMQQQKQQMQQQKKQMQQLAAENKRLKQTNVIQTQSSGRPELRGREEILQKEANTLRQQLEQAHEMATEAQSDYETLDHIFQPVQAENEQRKTMLNNMRRTALQISRSRQDLDLPTRRMGELDSAKLHALGVEVEEISSLQSVVCDPNFYPWRTRQVKKGSEEVETIVDWDNEQLGEIQRKYDGSGRGRLVAKEVLACNKEVQQWNPSGGYCVTIPYHYGEQRELQPEELLKISVGIDVPNCRPAVRPAHSPRSSPTAHTSSRGSNRGWESASSGSSGSGQRPTATI
jgi:hypothetical protein